MLEHISTYANTNTGKNVYILFNDDEGQSMIIEGDSISYIPDWDAPADIDYLNDSNYELIYIDSSNIDGISSDYKEELTPEGYEKICRYLLEELKKIK